MWAVFIWRETDLVKPIMKFRYYVVNARILPVRISTDYLSTSDI
jgi:hypothetical protein